MNIYRILADSTHVIAILLLLYKFFKTKSSAGVSGKTLILYNMVFLLRYADLLTTFISYYNTTMKLFFISISLFLLYLIYFCFNESYEREHDRARLDILVIPCVLLSLIVNSFNVLSIPSALEVFWATSILLEAIAMVPQFYFILVANKAEEYIMPYIVLMGCYRGLYVLNWIYRFNFEDYYEPISYQSSSFQAVIYALFFIYYFAYIKGETGTNYKENLPKYIEQEAMLGKKASSDIPSVFTVGSKKTYEYRLNEKV